MIWSDGIIVVVSQVLCVLTRKTKHRLAKKGDIYPIGDSQGTVTVDGQDWELWAGYNGDMKVFSFVAPSEIPTFESDVKAFYDHITDTQGFPADSQHLISMLSSLPFVFFSLPTLCG